ncbi:Fc.00g058120.m01.CDS01 [Cosmosporella sp. VM-42]
MKSFTLTSCCLAAFAFMSASASTSKIDVHAHYVPDFYAQALKDAGHTPGPDGMPSIPVWTPQSQLDFMAANNISKSYLSISSPGVYLTVPSKKATKAAVDLARKVNIYGSQLKKQYPDKFGFFASLPLPDVQSSLAEIKYIYNTLKPKPDGVVLMSNFYGMYFGDPALDPVYKALNALNVTIFEHPTMPCTYISGALFDINGNAPTIPQADWWALNRPIAKRQFAAPTLDFPFETARTFADLFVSEVPSRFPNLRWIMPHVGGGLIPTLNRIITYSSLYPDLSLTVASMKETLAKSFYFDLAGPWPVTEAIPPILRWVDYTKILWGSDTPWTPFAAGAAGAAAFDQGIETVFANGNGNEAFSVRTGNAQKLFGI